MAIQINERMSGWNSNISNSKCLPSYKSTSLQCLSQSQIAKCLGIPKRLNIWPPEWPQAPLLCTSLRNSHWVSLSLSSSPICGSLVDHKGAKGIAHVNSQWLVMPTQALLTTHSLLVPPQLAGHLLDWPLDADWPSSATFLWISIIYWLGDFSWPSEVHEDVRHLFTQLPLHEVFLCLPRIIELSRHSENSFPSSFYKITWASSEFST